MKNAPGRDNHRFDVSFLLKYLPIIGSPPEKSPLADISPTGKSPFYPGGRRAGRIFAGKLSVSGDFSGSDPTMGHRPSCSSNNVVVVYQFRWQLCSPLQHAHTDFDARRLDRLNNHVADRPPDPRRL